MPSGNAEAVVNSDESPDTRMVLVIGEFPRNHSQYEVGPLVLREGVEHPVLRRESLQGQHSYAPKLPAPPMQRDNLADGVRSRLPLAEPVFGEGLQQGAVALGLLKKGQDGRVSSDIPICLDRLEVVGCIAVDRKGWHDTKYGIRPAIGGSPVFPWYPIAPQLQPVRGSPFGPLSQISGAGAVRWLAG